MSTLLQTTSRTLSLLVLIWLYYWITDISDLQRILCASILAGAAVTVAFHRLLPLSLFAWVCAVSSFVLLLAVVRYEPALHIEPHYLRDARIIHGRAAEDSLPVDGRTSLLRLQVEQIEYSGRMSMSGDFGELTIWDPNGGRVFWGDWVSLYPAYVDESGEVTAYGVERTGSGSLLFALRSRVTRGIRSRLLAAGPDARELSYRLLLGDADNPYFPLARRITSIGCAHLLALSGMHLMLITSLLTLLIRPFAGRRIVALLRTAAAGAYLFLAGLKASLVRASLMYLSAAVPAAAGRKDLHPGMSLAAAYLIQLVIVPRTVSGLGFVLSYTALTGILLFADSLRGLFPAWMPKAVTASFSATLAAVWAVFPLTAELQESFSPAVFIGTLLLTPLIGLYMLLSAGVIAWPALSPALEGLLQVMSAAVNRLSHLPAASVEQLWFPSVPLLLTSAVSVRYLIFCGRMRANRKRNERYEHTDTLRFTQRDQAAACFGESADE